MYNGFPKKIKVLYDRNTVIKEGGQKEEVVREEEIIGDEGIGSGDRDCNVGYPEYKVDGGKILRRVIEVHRITEEFKKEIISQYKIEGSNKEKPNPLGPYLQKSVPKQEELEVNKEEENKEEEKKEQKEESKEPKEESKELVKDKEGIKEENKEENKEKEIIPSQQENQQKGDNDMEISNDAEMSEEKKEVNPLLSNFNDVKMENKENQMVSNR